MKIPAPLAYLNRIVPVEAPHAVSHAEGIAWMMQAKIRAAAESKRPHHDRILNLYERMIQQTALGTRHTVLADYTHQDWDRMELFQPFSRQDGSIAPWFAPPLSTRMGLFSHHALELAKRAFPEGTPAPHSLVEISCTGYVAPYSSQRLALARAWTQTRLLKLGHMGCYASIPGLNLAAQLAQSLPRGDDAFVSFFSVELSTLHLEPDVSELDQVIANILFADGAVRCDVGPKGHATSLALLAHREVLIENSLELMEWNLRDSSFHMILGRKVATKIAEVIRPHVQDFLLQAGLSWSDIGRAVIHPGGPKIIETVTDIFGWSEDQVRHSKAVLATCGNMSSATVPTIWSALQCDAKVKAGEFILSLAFGPGLTLAMNLMQKGHR